METRYTSDVAQLSPYARSFFEKQFRQREKSNRLAIPIPMVHMKLRGSFPHKEPRGARPFSRQ
jgi:hypothetical protein